MILSLWKVLESQKVGITHLAIGDRSHHVVTMEKVAEQHTCSKCSKCNTFQVISDLVHDFMTFNVSKLFEKFTKK